MSLPIKVQNDPTHLFRHADDSPSNINWWYDRELLVINFIKLNSAGRWNRKDVCHVYGNVRIEEWMGPIQFLFRRTRHDPETVRIGGHVTLSVPLVPVWGLRDFWIHVELFDAEDGHSIAEECFDWYQSRVIWNHTYSRLAVGSDDSSAIINYIVPSHSLPAQIDVMFKPHNGTIIGEKYFVSGSVVAEQFFVHAKFRPTRKITLLDRSDLEVGAGESMPLGSSYVVAQESVNRHSLKICVRFNGHVRGSDGEVVPFREIQRDIHFYVNFGDWCMKPRIFYVPVKYLNGSTKFSRFLQVYVTLF